jgi:excinuclease ABC subunit A
MNIAQAKAFFDQLELSPEESAVAARVLEDPPALKFLNDVGLDYLTLDRLSSTLSGGEAQRIQLATCLGFAPGGRVLRAGRTLHRPAQPGYGKAHPHPQELRDLGNTVIVVEHDADIMRAADYIVDLGPGAGEMRRPRGLRRAIPRADLQRDGSLTAAYLRGERRVSPARVRRRLKPRR